MSSEDHSYIYGDFDICPLAPDIPGSMRSVCISGAEKLVVQNLRRPPAFGCSSRGLAVLTMTNQDKIISVRTRCVAGMHRRGVAKGAIWTAFRVQQLTSVA
jgi:hypothetical protein